MVVGRDDWGKHGKEAKTRGHRLDIARESEGLAQHGGADGVQWRYASRWHASSGRSSGWAAAQDGQGIEAQGLADLGGARNRPRGGALTRKRQGLAARAFACVMAFVLVLGSYLSCALADFEPTQTGMTQNWLGVIQKQEVLDEDISQGMTYWGFIIGAWNTFDAAAYACGLSTSQIGALDLTVRAKASNASTGGKFYELAQLMQQVQYGSGTTIPFWTDASFISTLYMMTNQGTSPYIWLATVPKRLLTSAKEDFQVIRNGGNLGGGSNPSDTETLTFVGNTRYGTTLNNSVQTLTGQRLYTGGWVNGAGVGTEVGNRFRKDGTTGNWLAMDGEYSVTITYPDLAEQFEAYPLSDYRWFLEFRPQNVSGEYGTIKLNSLDIHIYDNDKCDVETGTNKYYWNGTEFEEHEFIYSVSTTDGSVHHIIDLYTNNNYDSSNQPYTCDESGLVIDVTGNGTDVRYSDSTTNLGVSGSAMAMIFELDGSGGGGSGGGGGGGNNWPVGGPTEPTPEPPEVPTPNDPVYGTPELPEPGDPTTPNPDPPSDPYDPPINPPTPYTPIVDPPNNVTEPTGEAIDYRPYLLAILHQIQYFQSDLYGWIQDLIGVIGNVTDWLSTINTSLSSHCDHITTAIGNNATYLLNGVKRAIEVAESDMESYLIEISDYLAGLIDDSLAQRIYELETYLKTLFEWLAEQMSFNFGDAYDDSSLMYWLQRIYSRLGNGRKSVGNGDTTDPVDPFNWLLWLINKVLGAIGDVLTDFVGDLGDFIAAVKDKFPFSIPWDVVAYLTALDAARQTPEFTVSIPAIQGWWSDDVEFDIDLSPYDEAMAAVRSMVCLWWGFVLVMKTDWLGKVFDGAVETVNGAFKRMAGAGE